MYVYIYKANLQLRQQMRQHGSPKRPMYKYIYIHIHIYSHTHLYIDIYRLTNLKLWQQMRQHGSPKRPREHIQTCGETEGTIDVRDGRIRVRE